MSNQQIIKAELDGFGGLRLEGNDATYEIREALGSKGLKFRWNKIEGHWYKALQTGNHYQEAYGILKQIGAMGKKVSCPQLSAAIAEKAAANPATTALKAAVAKGGAAKWQYRSLVMKAAHEIRLSKKVSMGDALKQAWAMVK